MTDTNSPCDGICCAPGACIILGRIIANGLSIDPLIRSAWPGVPRVPLDHVDDAAEVRRLARPGADGRPLVSLHHCLGLMERLVD